jgi:hypothetical protein
MKKLKSILLMVLSILLLTGVLSDPGLAQPRCYLPYISFDPTPVVIPVTPEAVVGTWIMTTVVTGSTDFYLHIGADGSMNINDYPDDREHLPGNWGISGGTFLGHFINLNLNPEDFNPNGDLVGTFINRVFTLDFIEYWHDPPKHILYTATRL